MLMLLVVALLLLLLSLSLNGELVFRAKRFCLPLLFIDLVFSVSTYSHRDFRLSRVISINVSGHKYGLTYVVGYLCPIYFVSNVTQFVQFTVMLVLDGVSGVARSIFLLI
jgi:uncharacterized membrane protein YhdT